MLTMHHPTDEEITSLLLSIISDGFNCSMRALESAGAIDRTKMSKQYCGVGSKYYDMVTDEMMFIAQRGTPAIRQIFYEAAQTSSVNPGSPGSGTRMEPQRQEAYRHLLYAVLVQLRSGHRDAVWWNPASWLQRASELRRNKEVADAFHNLALYSVRDFQGFKEDLFWQDIERLQQEHGSKSIARYRHIFDEYVSGRAACLC